MQPPGAIQGAKGGNRSLSKESGYGGGGSGNQSICSFGRPQVKNVG